MRKLIQCASLSLLILTVAAGSAIANDVDAYSVNLQNYTGTPKTLDVQFSLDQKNVFPVGLTDGNGATYHDRIWVFVKYFNTAWAANHAWGHATLVAGGSVGAYSGATGVGITADGKGAFCRIGVNQTLRWAAGTDETLTGTENFKVRVFAIEVVRAPAGAFWVGSGGTESGSFTDGSWTSGATIPLKITAQGAITIDATPGNLWGTSTTGNNTIGGAGATHELFPTGYNAFYCMKYEVTQGQYRDFLNTLTRAQQNARAGSGTNLASGQPPVTATYVMANTSWVPNNYGTNNYRNGIRCDPVIPATDPITFYCDYNANYIRNESADGASLPCNYLSWADLVAYADWAGLRPMTELEYEKACRGRLSATDTAAANVVANEYAWGTATIASSAYTMVNPGEPNEGITTNYSTTLGNASYTNTQNSRAMFRSGIFAANGSNTGRVTSGASYYGIMELSGNLYERTVTIGNSEGRSFQGTQGDGDLTTTNTDWPVAETAVGSGSRGGDWNSVASRARVSDRNNAADTSSSRLSTFGGRCVRTE